MTATETVPPIIASAWRGVAYASIAASLFALNGSVSKTVLESGMSSLRLVELCSLGAALCLLTAVALTRPRSLRIAPRELGFLVVAGVVGIGLVQWTFTAAAVFCSVLAPWWTFPGASRSGIMGG